MNFKWVPWLLVVELFLAIHFAIVAAGTGLGIVEVPKTFAAVMLLLQGNREGFAERGWTWPDGPAGLIWFVVFVVLFAAVTIAVLVQFDKRGGHRNGDRSGLSTAGELKKRAKGGNGAALIEPFCRLAGRPIPIRVEDSVLTYAPPRWGKTAFIAAGRIIDAFGAVVATSTKADLFRLTVKLRMRVGRVWVFDFDGITRWPNLARWDMVAGCEDPGAAQTRAAAIVNARPTDSNMRDSVHFVDGVRIILRGLLHAAALSGGSMRDVVRWSQNFNDEEAATILRRRSPNGTYWARELDAWCREDAPDTIGNTKTTLSRIISPMMDSRVLELLCPPEDDSEHVDVFRATDFITTKDTVYCLVDDSRGTSTAPIITALVSAIIEAAKTASQHSITGRLPSTLTAVLDEVANVAPIPQLPNLMSDGGGRGINTWVFAQAPSQLVSRWGQEGAETILGSASAKVVMGGLSDDAFLERISRLIGTHYVDSTSKSRQQGHDGRSSSSESTSEREERRLKLEQIRKIPEGQALLMYRELEGVVDLVPWWERKDADELRASIKWALLQEGIHA